MSERSAWKNNIVGHGEIDPRQVVKHPRNPKVHPPEQDVVVGASLGRWGQIKSVTINTVTGHLLDGEERVELAIRQGQPTIQVEYVSVPEAEEGDVIMTLDASAGLSRPHWGRWSALYREAQTHQHGPDLLEFWAQVALQQPVDGEVGPDRRTGRWKVEDEGEVDMLLAESEGVRARWQVAAGDVWELGPHRVSCGDCRDPQVVARLLAGEVPQAVVTDPIYGQSRPGVPHDEEAVTQVAVAAAGVVPGADLLWAVFQSPRQLLAWTEALAAAGCTFERLLWMYKAAQCTYPWRGWLLKSEAIIIASRGAPAWQDVHPYAHDCYYLHEVKGELPEDVGWHGSVKPLSVVADLVQRLCAPGGVVFDGFVGSGTTLLACEQTGRVCRAIDLDPACVAVTLERYTRATGTRPQKG